MNHISECMCDECAPPIRVNPLLNMQEDFIRMSDYKDLEALRDAYEARHKEHLGKIKELEVKLETYAKILSTNLMFVKIDELEKKLADITEENRSLKLNFKDQSVVHLQKKLAESEKKQKETFETLLVFGANNVNLQEKLKMAVEDLEKLVRDVEAGWTMRSMKSLKNIIEKIKQGEGE